MKHTAISILIISLILIAYGCERDSTVDPPEKQAYELTEEGWDKHFQYKGYENALNKFKEAITVDDSYADAYNGAGWASARLSQLTNAIDYFKQCISIDASIADAHAGLAFVYYAQREYTEAIAAAKTTLQKDANWTFSRDSSTGYKDLHLVIAACYFATGDYPKSLAEVKVLNSSFDVDVGTIEGKAALADEIERLRSVV